MLGVSINAEIRWNEYGDLERNNEIVLKAYSNAALFNMTFFNL